jgi:hypothetical protein
VLACSDVSGPPPSTEAPSPSFSANVSRFTTPFFDIVVDESRNLAAVVGLGHDQLAGFCNGEDVALDQVNVLEVTRPDGSVKITVRGRPRVTVYSIAGVSDLCELTRSTPLGAGRANLSQTDNDVFVSFNRTNSFGTNLVGTASGEGGRFKVRLRFRITIQRNGNFTVRSEEVSIRPLGA